MRIILNIIRWLFIVFFVIIISFEAIMYINTKILKKDFPNVFGYAFLSVKTRSMEPTIMGGSIILVKTNKNYNINDIVVYSEEDAYITHRIVSKNGYKYETKGDANNISESISYDMIKAKVVYYGEDFSNFMVNIRNPIVLIILGVLGIIIPEIFLNVFKKKSNNEA